MQLHSETQVGPWQLGPIDTTKYDRHRLDTPLWQLADAILDLSGAKRWLCTQVCFFLRPVVHGLGGAIINRAVLRGVHHIISEQAVAGYLLAFRISMWPNNYPAPAAVSRTPEQKRELREELESSLISNVVRKFTALFQSQSVIMVLLTI